MTNKKEIMLVKVPAREFVDRMTNYLWNGEPEDKSLIVTIQDKVGDEWTTRQEGLTNTVSRWHSDPKPYERVRAEFAWNGGSWLRGTDGIRPENRTSVYVRANNNDIEALFVRKKRKDGVEVSVVEFIDSSGNRTRVLSRAKY